MTSDNDSASTSGLVLDDLVSTLESFLVVGSPQLISERIGSDSSEVGGRLLRENVLYRDYLVSFHFDRRSKKGKNSENGKRESIILT